MTKKIKSGATEGRILYRRWRLPFGFEWRSDLIAHDYMRRRTLSTPWGAIRIHHILRSDQREHFHDHPFDFTSLILAGGYVEHRPGMEPRTCRPGSVVRRRAEDLHALELIGKSAWTIVVTGPIRRDWGFMTEDGWVPASQYDEWKRKRFRRSCKVLTLSECLFRRANEIAARVVNVSAEERLLRRGKLVPGSTGWLWCSHCGGHMVSPDRPEDRCVRCRGS